MPTFCRCVQDVLCTLDQVIASLARKAWPQYIVAVLCSVYVVAIVVFVCCQTNKTRATLNDLEKRAPNTNKDLILQLKVNLRDLLQDGVVGHLRLRVEASLSAHMKAPVVVLSFCLSVCLSVCLFVCLAGG